jgi:hypothetical protein
MCVAIFTDKIFQSFQFITEQWHLRKTRKEAMTGDQ